MVNPLIRRKDKIVTVEKAVQRERSRPFQQQVREYQGELRQRVRTKPSFLAYLQRGGITRALYKQPVAPAGSNIPNIQERRFTGRRGRPKGSYDQRYAQYGGVYGYRKMLNQKLREQRLEAMRRTAVTPQQEAVIRQIEARRMAEMQNPERKTIPSTYGQVSMRGLMDEIDSASNIFS